MRSSSATSVSIIVLPTNFIRSSPTPSAREVLDRLVASAGSRAPRDGRRDPVDLLRHRPVEAPQPRLDVGRPGSRSLAAQSAAPQRRVDVARHEHEVGRLVREHRLEPLQHPGDLLGVAARSRPRACGRARARRAPRGRSPTSAGRSAGRCGRSPWRQSGNRRAQRPDDRRHLDEVRTRPDDVEDAHRARRVSGRAAPSRWPGRRSAWRARSRPRSAHPRRGS